jgi:hypothetical protein
MNQSVETVGPGVFRNINCTHFDQIRMLVRHTAAQPCPWLLPSARVYTRVRCRHRLTVPAAAADESL